MPILRTLTTYPVKSLRGITIDTTVVERMGLENDRRLMVVDTHGRFVTQRQHARMALITPALNDGTLTLSTVSTGTLTMPIIRYGQKKKVEIWQSKGVEAIDQGDQAAEWLSDFLHISVRLVRLAEDYQRKVSAEYATQLDDHVSFADGFPILIISQESLDDLNTRLVKPIPMNRFRPNIVVGGVVPFAEDDWKRIRIGPVEMAIVKPCARCNVPTIDQETAESGKEPNSTLAQYRKINGKVMFGMNVIPLTVGRLRVGDSAEILD